MAKNKIKKKETDKVKGKKTESFKNPAKTSWGRLLILILTGAMALVSFALLIYYIVIMVKSV